MDANMIMNIIITGLMLVNLLIVIGYNIRVNRANEATKCCQMRKRASK